MRLKPWLDVMRFSPRTNDAKTDGFVVFELQFQNCFEDGLAHRQPVLCFSFLNDAETHRTVVGCQESVQS